MATATSKKRRRVDLNKIRAARLEAKGEGPEVEFGENVFKLPPELPFTVVEAFGTMNANAQDEEFDGFVAASAVLDAAKGLLGPDQFDLFMKEQPSSEDFSAFIEAVLEEYGVTAGESEASPES